MFRDDDGVGFLSRVKPIASNPAMRAGPQSFRPRASARLIAAVRPVHQMERVPPLVQD
jgi:hypothetical protein